MYSKEEFKQLKKDFWTKFGQFSQLKRERLGLGKKWMLYKTGLKGLELKFDFENNNCIVAIEIDSATPNAEDYLQKIQVLKTEITSPYGLPLMEDLRQASGRKMVYRYYFEKTELNFKNKANWPDIFEFFYKHMYILEAFIIENKEILDTKA